MPWHEQLLAYLRAEKEKGRKIVLATAANRNIADAVSKFLGLFDEVLASDGSHNLKGRTKLKAIQEKIGTAFVYAGNSKVDLPIWKAAQAAILVGTSPRLKKTVCRDIQVEHNFPGVDRSLSVWLRTLRIHQWLKNLLLFVPLLTAYSFLRLDKLASTTIAFFVFSLVASACYIINDLWDIENDRAHPRKRYRPFASASIPILKGIAVAGVLLSFAFVLALIVSKGFLIILVLYFVLICSYSCSLKRYIMIDVIILSLLYTLRIVVGSVVTGLIISSWLLVFSVFFFLSLALVKRCSELVSLEQVGRKVACGRNYRISDLAVLYPLGIGSALSAMVVFGLFINAPETQMRYATPNLLWLAVVCMIYWLARLWVKTSRGEIHDDPVIYAIKDRNSCVVLLVVTSTMLVAHFMKLRLTL